MCIVDVVATLFLSLALLVFAIDGNEGTRTGLFLLFCVFVLVLPGRSNVQSQPCSNVSAALRSAFVRSLSWQHQHNTERVEFGVTG